jgi:hypothetical protein
VIGYHELIRPEGRLELCRPATRAGAHAFGIDAISVGIGIEGHDDIEPFTDAPIATFHAELRTTSPVS